MKRPEEVYSYKYCPICRHDEFFSCEAYDGGGDSDGQVGLDIKPNKFRFTIIDGPGYALPYYWAGCPNCNYLITKINTEKLTAAIKKWLKSESIDNTTPSTCLSCDSGNTLLWKFDSKRIKDFKVRFNWAKTSFKFSFLRGRTRHLGSLGDESNVCFDCGLVSVLSSPGSIKEKSHKRYLKKWASI